MAKMVEITLKPGNPGRTVPVSVGPGAVMMVEFKPGIAVMVPEEHSKWFRTSEAYRVGPDPKVGDVPAKTNRRK